MAPMSMDSDRFSAPLMSKLQEADTSPDGLSPLAVSVTPKNSSRLASPIIPSVSAGKTLAVSSRTANGIELETPR